MSAKSEQTAEDRVVQDYFRTTSAIGSARDTASFTASLAGLQRRLGNWFDVQGKDVVDLGSGTGELCKLAVQLGAMHVVGVNMSAGEIEFARGQVDAEFVLQDMEAYLQARPEASVDRIFAWRALD